MPGATDARFFRAQGAIAYGVGLFDDRVSFSEFLSLFHGHDERVSVRSVERTTDLIERVVAHFGERTCRGTGPMSGNLICDLDGVVYRGTDAVPESATALSALEAAGWKIIFSTNNSARTPEEVADRIGSITGYAAKPDQVVTSAVGGRRPAFGHQASDVRPGRGGSHGSSRETRTYP